MTIEIEAGASQPQCSTETASVHAVSRSKNEGRVDRSCWGAAIAGDRCHSHFRQVRIRRKKNGEERHHP
jgi:hypothetical protein